MRTPAEQRLADAEYALERRRYWLKDAEYRRGSPAAVRFWRAAVKEQETKLRKLRRASAPVRARRAKR